MTTERDPAALQSPMQTCDSEGNRARLWQTLKARLDRTEREIQRVLATVRNRAGLPAQHAAGPTRLELARLEAARSLRERIEREIQALLGETEEPR
ncbi:MAG TPA: hypothetical protein VFO28_09440 [Burkholderiaceae bacterium]|nr:hypothetical protein [Burkholderiaceae bacterium]